eukprot:GHVQ01034454.1.p1 GENE.GHVQ01034454.1~~GHVQ01034454.1.p1  ORF type:complete len:260 (-),score=35.12 GHVQ01034454.1:588-1367(-)
MDSSGDGTRALQRKPLLVRVPASGAFTACERRSTPVGGSSGGFRLPSPTCDTSMDDGGRGRVAQRKQRCATDSESASPLRTSYGTRSKESEKQLEKSVNNDMKHVSGSSRSISSKKPKHVSNAISIHDMTTKVNRIRRMRRKRKKKGKKGKNGNTNQSPNNSQAASNSKKKLFQTSLKFPSRSCSSSVSPKSDKHSHPRPVCDFITPPSRSGSVSPASHSANVDRYSEDAAPSSVLSGGCRFIRPSPIVVIAGEKGCEG